MPEKISTVSVLSINDIEILEKQFTNYLLTQTGIRIRRGLLASLTQHKNEWLTQVKTLSGHDLDSLIELGQASHETIQFLQNYLQALEDGFIQLIYGLAHSGILNTEDLKNLKLNPHDL